MNYSNCQCCHTLTHDIYGQHGVNFLPMYQKQVHQYNYNNQYQQTMNQHSPYRTTPFRNYVGSPDGISSILLSKKPQEQQECAGVIYINKSYNENVVPLSPISFQSLDSFDNRENTVFNQYQQHQVHSNKHISPISFQSFDSFDYMQNTAFNQYQQHQNPVHSNKHISPLLEGHREKKATRKITDPNHLKCMICLKTFSRPYNLKSHQRTHTKERPFKCSYNQCGWKFARPHDLKRHELLHSGAKPFACSCGKRFSRSDAFKRHRQVNPSCF